MCISLLTAGSESQSPQVGIRHFGLPFWDYCARHGAEQRWPPVAVSQLLLLSEMAGRMTGVAGEVDVGGQRVLAEINPIRNSSLPMRTMPEVAQPGSGGSTSRSMFRQATQARQAGKPDVWATGFKGPRNKTEKRPSPNIRSRLLYKNIRGPQWRSRLSARRIKRLANAILMTPSYDEAVILSCPTRTLSIRHPTTSRMSPLATFFRSMSAATPAELTTAANSLRARSLPSPTTPCCSISATRAKAFCPCPGSRAPAKP
jgi:hypothetical protein